MKSPICRIIMDEHERHEKFLKNPFGVNLNDAKVASSAIWKPTPSTSFQWQLNTGHINTHNRAHVYDVDLFEVPTSTIKYLHDHGKKVICYFSAGTFEDGNSRRPDSGDFPDYVKGHTLKDWHDEKWLDIRKSVVRTIMTARLKLARDKGCDGVEPDNVDGYQPVSKSGFHLQPSDQLTYNKWLAQEAHHFGLSVGLKNDVGQIHELQPYFDWALNEECLDYDECNDYSPFIKAHKAVFHVEYVDHHSQGPSKKNAVCHDNGRPHQFITLIKDWDLTDWELHC